MAELLQLSPSLASHLSRPHIDTTAQLCSTFLHIFAPLCFSYSLHIMHLDQTCIKCGSSKEILYSSLLNIWSPSFVPPVQQMAVSRRSQGLRESAPWEQQWTCRPGRFCVPAIQDDTLKVKAVTVRRPVLLGRSLCWEISLTAENRKNCRSTNGSLVFLTFIKVKKMNFFCAGWRTKMAKVQKKYSSPH